MEKTLIVSVRMNEADLRKLQLIARVCERSVGELIRVATRKEIGSMARRKDLMAKVSEIQKRNEIMLNELLVAAGVKKEKKK